MRCCVRSRRALPTTDDRAIAAAAITGESNSPVNGLSTPAAIGMGYPVKGATRIRDDHATICYGPGAVGGSVPTHRITQYCTP